MTVVFGMPAVQAADRFAHGLLWRVSKPGVPASFVFGTVHLADPRVLDLAAPVKKALDGTHFFASEFGTDVVVLDPALEDAENLLRGTSLAALTGEPTFSKLKVLLVAHGVPDAQVDRMKPWAALLRVSRNSPPADVLTLDQHLLGMARARRMHIMPLESVEEQIAAFDSIPLDTQVALLRYAVANRDALAADGDATVEAWLRRDLAELGCIAERAGRRDSAIAPHYRALCKHVIANRTVLLHYRLALPLRVGRVFVAVGASHLHGVDGLLRMLEQDGYSVTRVW